MRMTTLPLAILLTLAASMAQAGVDVHIDLNLPAAPPLVLVRPGIQVVEGFPEEVFFHEGWYWCRRPDGWYRARAPRDRFDWVQGRKVPKGLMKEPPGHYKNWHHKGGNGRPNDQTGYEGHGQPAPWTSRPKPGHGPKSGYVPPPPVHKDNWGAGDHK